MQPNRLKSKLLRGEPCLGAACVLGSVESVEIVCHSGYDFVLVDWEHGSFSRDQVRESVRAIQTTETTAIGRPYSQGLGQIKWLLDMGYSGLLVPMVTDAAEARAVVEAAYYPPLGQRSQGASRANLFHGSDYREKNNDELLLMVIVEDVTGVDNCEQIAQVEGVSGIFIGATDLASSMGITLTTGGGPAKYEQAVSRVHAACKHAGKIPGVATNAAQLARRRIEQGFTFLTLSTDFRILSKAMLEMRNHVLELGD